MGDKTSTQTNTGSSDSQVSDQYDVTGGLSIGAGTVGYLGNNSTGISVSGSNLQNSYGATVNTSIDYINPPVDPSVSALDSDLLLAAGKNMSEDSSGQGGGASDPSLTSSPSKISSGEVFIFVLIIAGLVVFL